MSRCRLAERSRCHDATSMAGVTWSARYRGACPCKQRSVMRPSLKVTLTGTSNQCSSSCRSVDKPRSNFRVPLTTRAAVLSTRCTLSVTVFGAPAFFFYYHYHYYYYYYDYYYSSTVQFPDYSHKTNSTNTLWNFYTGCNYTCHVMHEHWPTLHVCNVMCHQKHWHCLKHDVNNTELCVAISPPTIPTYP